LKVVNIRGEPLTKSRVTVAIPTFNRVYLLARAVESAMAQSYEDVEIIVSDNCSQDGTRDYLQTLIDPRIRVLQQPVNVGMVRNWDFCLSKATGEYFLLLSDDDYFQDKDALIKFVASMQEGPPHCRLVISEVSIVKVNTSNVEHAPSLTTYPPKCAISNQIITSVCSGLDVTVLTPFVALEEALEGKLNVLPCATMLYTSDIRTLGGYGVFNAKLAVDACVWQSICITTGGLKKIKERLLVYSLHQSESSASIGLWESEQSIVNHLTFDLSSQHLQLEETTKLKELQMSAVRRLPLSVIKRNISYNQHYTLKKFVHDVWKYRYRIVSSLLIYYLPRFFIQTATQAFRPKN
jgi:glycosyltransferase involved in cell wall biosynthesis